ncbi:hypothetical protein B484DRAFT_484888, partial [Ochromonadaceae sp. CCMP2298]
MVYVVRSGHYLGGGLTVHSCSLDASTASVSYVAMLDSTLTSFLSTYSSVTTLTPTSVLSSLNVLLSMLVLLAAFGVGFVYAQRLDRDDDSKGVGRTEVEGVRVLYNLNQ